MDLLDVLLKFDSEYGDAIFYSLMGAIFILSMALITRDTIRELMGKKPIKKGRFVKMVLH